MGKRSYGTGHLYEKHGSYYGMWRSPNGRRINRKIGKIRAEGPSIGRSAETV